MANLQNKSMYRVDFFFNKLWYVIVEQINRQSFIFKREESKHRKVITKVNEIISIKYAFIYNIREIDQCP